VKKQAMCRQNSKEELKDLIKLTREYISREGFLGIGKSRPFLSNRQVKEKVDHSGEKSFSKEEMFTKLRDKYADCQRCSLARTRTHLVFGGGNHHTNLVFVGEAPGREEDLKGFPFVGRAGRLLDNILAAIGLSRSEIYITNILKCRPPNNRDPSPEEVSTCQQILWEQLDVIRPKLICALGRFAAQTLLTSEERIGKLRGNWFELKGMKLLVTYHPAYLLRNPQDKRLVWEDMKKLKAEYGKVKS